MNRKVGTKKAKSHTAHLNEELVQEGTAELGKFLKMYSEGVSNLTMPSRFIDVIWHDMLENPEEYEAFSNKFAGMVVGHEPIVGEGKIEWVTNYEKRFGKLNSTWFMDQNGRFNKKAYEEYQKTGVWRASWDCGPCLHYPTLNCQ
ncbi:hypothetical protein [Bacillus cereus]|uniref:Uncharacterized protein n=1 Tax=Bacillus cereus HuA3-9 TaxID=1053205 RepID=R8CB45_BACCE|nr:hypothetical protein [Bacillus cereus]EOO08755.1 hypothetical protein IGA_06329 [Bacillus cereus HuA3-9]